VAPRFLATMMALPLLTGESIFIGIAAAYALCVDFLGIDPAYTWHNMIKYTDVQNFEMGLIKAFIYGAIIALISCYKGLTCREGAEGVGRATTEAVVYSSITILITNFFLTLFLNRVLWMA
jgi:phospholipid/cholesterol/gamma-HCH transport system permease protein